MLVMCDAMAACVVCAACRKAVTSEEPKNKDGCEAAMIAGTRASKMPPRRGACPVSGGVHPASRGIAGALSLPGRACPPARGERCAGRGKRLRGLAGFGLGCESAHLWAASGLEEGERSFLEDAAAKLLAETGNLQRLGGLRQGEQIRRSLADVAGEDDAVGAVLRDQRHRGIGLEQPRLQRQAAPAADPAR